jgi:hypothetical protein
MDSTSFKLSAGGVEFEVWVECNHAKILVVAEIKDPLKGFEEQAFKLVYVNNLLFILWPKNRL